MACAISKQSKGSRWEWQILQDVERCRLDRQPVEGIDLALLLDEASCRSGRRNLTLMVISHADSAQPDRVVRIADGVVNRSRERLAGNPPQEDTGIQQQVHW